jgi:uncharacterized protein
MLLLAGFVCGFIFGLGLLISGMTQPTKVLNFLDLFGAWDPSLAVVMVAALAVSGVGFAVVKQRAPLLAPRNQWPTRTDIDRPLLIGSALFGIGWGLVGLCPGPALENLADAVAARHRLRLCHGRWNGVTRFLADTAVRPRRTCYSGRSGRIAP